jgi:hypothetical protein
MTRWAGSLTKPPAKVVPLPQAAAQSILCRGAARPLADVSISARQVR